MKNFRLDDEGGNQEALFSWARLQAGKYPELETMFHVPNEGRRSVVNGAKLKRQGMKAGIPDIVLPASRAGYNHLYIELKAGKGKLSKEQKAMLEKLKQQGNYTAVCYGWETARYVIINYLEGNLKELGEPGAIWEQSKPEAKQGIDDLLIGI